MQKPPKLRESRFDDYKQIAALAAQFDLRTEDYEAWTHLWSDNPAYRKLQGRLPMGWVLDKGDGTIGGYLGNIPMAYEYQGKCFLAATTRAWVVDTPYRAFSPFLLATYFQQPHIDLFLSTTVNSQSEAAYTSFQSTRVPVGAWDRTLFWITNYRGFVASYLRKSSGVIAGAASYPLSAGLFMSDQLKGRRSPDPAPSVAVQDCNSFDERFQDFWEDLRKAKSSILLADRSRESLDWHFRFALQQRSAWIYIAEKDSGLSAYSVFLRNDYPQVGLKRMRLVDFQCLDHRAAPDTLISMLGAAIERCRRESIHMFELVGVTPEFEKQLDKFSPHGRSLGSWLYFYKTNNPLLGQELQNPRVWEPSLFDGDSSL